LGANSPFPQRDSFMAQDGSPFARPHGPQFQRGDGPSGSPELRNEGLVNRHDTMHDGPGIDPRNQGFRDGRGGRRNDFNARRRNTMERSFRDMEQQAGAFDSAVSTPVKTVASDKGLAPPIEHDAGGLSRPKEDEPKTAAGPIVESKPLSCLQEQDRDRARVVVSKMGSLLGLPLSIEHLPQTKDILKAMALLDSQIKTAGNDVEKRKVALTEALTYEREQARSVRLEAIAQATDQANLRLSEEEAKEQAEVEKFEVTLSDYDKKEHGDFEATLSAKSRIVDAELLKITKEEEKKQREILNEQMIQTADDFDQKIAALREQLDRSTALVKKHDSRLQAIREKARSEKSLVMGQKEGNCLVSRIIAENRAKASKAHMDSLGSIPDGLTETSGLETIRDPKLNRTTSEWSTMARQVTGISNALYCEPSEAPYFESNEKKHAAMAPYISEFIKQRGEKLMEHWTELADEYEERRKVFNKKLGKRSRKSLSAIPARQLPVTQIGGGSTATVGRPNPYRRARREVRSDYEQEKLIEELKLEEAMEKRIQFGGCTVPRQIGALEKKLTPQFRNTFRAQRIDLIEMEQDLLNTSVWSDMEKCIFLDR
jgi:hypothetical protein